MAQNKILGKVAFATQYAKLKADGTRESYIDAMNRVKAMHIEKFPALEQRIEQVFKDFVYPQIVFPSQRSTQLEAMLSRETTCAYIIALLVIAIECAFSLRVFGF